jgi:hypothetical protein
MDAVVAQRLLKGARGEMFEPLLMELQERRKELAIARCFEERAQYHAAFELVFEFHHSECQSELQQQSLTEQIAQAKAVEDEMKAYDSDTAQLFIEMKSAQAQKREDLIEVQSSEQREHAAQMKSVQKQRCYNRPWNRVMILHHQQRLLAGQCRFLDAASVTKVISDTTQTDEFLRTKSRQRDFEESVCQLKAKQAAELYLLEEHLAMELAQLHQWRTVLGCSLQHKSKNIEAHGFLVKDLDMRYWNTVQKQGPRPRPRQWQWRRHANGLEGKMFDNSFRIRPANISELGRMRTDSWLCRV